MTNIIWKYEIQGAARQTVMMPKDAEILTAQMQGSRICLWAMVDPEAPKKRREIEVLGTANLLASEVRMYIGTVQVQSNTTPFVLHIFENLE